MLGGLADWGCAELESLFGFIASGLGHPGDAPLRALRATGLAMAGQVEMNVEALTRLHERLGIEGGDPEAAFERNRGYLEAAEALGREMGSGGEIKNPKAKT